MEDLFDQSMTMIEDKWSAQVCEELFSRKHFTTALTDELKQVQQIQLQIEKSFSAVLARLGGNHNHFIPFNRLPDELLHIIFRWACRGGLNYKVNARILCVCKRWNRVALDYGPLWGTMRYRDITGSHQRTKLFLERSGLSPLSIVDFTLSAGLDDGVSDEYDEDTEYAELDRFSRSEIPRGNLNMCRLHLPRIKTLQVPRPLEWVADRWIFDMPAPSLETLSLRGCVSQIHPNFIYPSIFGNNHPRLRSLSLFNCRRHLQAGIFSGLTTLSLVVTTDGALQQHGYYLTGQENILDVLHSSPNLRTFRLSLPKGMRLHPLEHGVPTVLATDHPERIALRSLTKLSLALSIDELVGFLGRVSLPDARTSVHITYAGPDPAIDWVNSLFSPSCIPDSLLHYLHTLKVPHHFGDAFSGTGQGPDGSKYELSVSCGPLILVSLLRQRFDLPRLKNLIVLPANTAAYPHHFLDGNQGFHDLASLLVHAPITTLTFNEPWYANYSRQYPGPYFASLYAALTANPGHTDLRIENVKILGEGSGQSMCRFSECVPGFIAFLQRISPTGSLRSLVFEGFTLYVTEEAGINAFFDDLGAMDIESISNRMDVQVQST